MQFLRRLYGFLLNLYPKTYREEYGEELQAVFDLSLEEAVAQGGVELEKLVLRELLSLPRAVILEHLRERRNARMVRGSGPHFDFSHGSWKEFLTAMLPFFLVCAALPLLTYLGRLGMIPAAGGVVNGIVYALLGLFVILFLLGLRKGLPRWSLPYLGFVLALLSVYIFSGLLGGPIYLLFPGLLDRSSLFLDIFWDGVFWYGLLIIIALLVALTRLSPAFERFRNDWTLLCFLLYGAIPFALVLSYDEYQGDEPYTLLAFLVLALGAWIYLRSHDPWKRFGALFGALALVMLITTVSKAILVPIQDWPIVIDAGLARSEVKHTVITWGWIALGMLIPTVINFFPRSTKSLQTAWS